MIKCIFTIIKNEHRYLEEWIEHHIRMGFNKFIIFEESGSISHDKIIEKYNKVSHIDYYDNILSQNKNENNDVICLKYILENYNDIDWLIKLDVDEYIMLKNNKTIDDILYNINDVKQITYKYKIYNACGFINEPTNLKYSIVDTYIGSIENKDIAYYFSNINKYSYDLYKSLINYKWYYKYYNETKFISNNFPYSFLDEVNIYNDGEINKYVTKSFEEFYNKINKEHGNLLEFFVLNPDLIQKIPEIESKFKIDVFI